VNQILLGSEITLDRLHGLMAEQHLDLLQFPASGSAQLGTRAAAIVGRDSSNSGGLRVGPCQTTFSLRAVSRICQLQFTDLNTEPSAIPAVVAQSLP
jgi:hypothetical protein